MKLTAGSVDSACYTNGVLDREDRSLPFLVRNDEWRFLAEDGLVIFSTAKSAADLEYSYEYKLKYIPETSDRFSRLAQSWDDPKERAALAYFSRRRSVGDFENRGIWLVGMERPRFSGETRIKVYFRTFYENGVGDRLYADSDFLAVIASCGIDGFRELAALAGEYLRRSLHVYMVSWNHDRLSKASKYKIYLIADGETDKKLFDELFRAFGTDGADRSRISEMLRRLPVRFAGLSLCLDTDGKKSVNLYYHREL